MRKAITATEFRINLGAILNRIMIDEDEYIIMKNNLPIAKLVPFWTEEKKKENERAKGSS